LARARVLQCARPGTVPRRCSAVRETSGTPKRGRLGVQPWIALASYPRIRDPPTAARKASIGSPEKIAHTLEAGVVGLQRIVRLVARAGWPVVVRSRELRLEQEACVVERSSARVAWCLRTRSAQAR
jgi:hypothetical protein